MEAPNMVSVLGRFAPRAFVFLLLAAASGAIRAQEMRNRELRPAFDFTMIQTPVEIVSIKLNGKDVQPGEKIKGNDDWLKGLSFTLKNVSDKPIAYIDVGLQFPQPRGFVVYSLNYGVDFSRGEARTESSPPAIQPGESLDLVLTNERYQVFLNILDQGGASSSFETAPYFIEKVCFANEPDVIWQGGFLKRRDPNQVAKFDIIGRYVLPIKQK
jgi:hypothetical protein